jgi:hypothetical protein
MDHQMIGNVEFLSLQQLEIFIIFWKGQIVNQQSLDEILISKHKITAILNIIYHKK